MSASAQRAMALAFTALMLVSTMPASNARHIDPDVPDVPELPRVYPTQNCIPIGLDAEILRRVNSLTAGDPAFYQDPLGVPSLCVNGPVTEYQAAVYQANAVLDHVRTVSREIQRQVNWRLENALPESEYPNELVQPRVVLLNDSFDGYRVGGFGDWTVVTEKGEDPLWSIQRIDDVNGTEYAYRFGRSDGYEHDARQFLVSPEIDLTAISGNRTAVRDLVTLRTRAHDALSAFCKPGAGSILGIVGGGQVSVDAFCDAGRSATLPIDSLIRAYELAVDEHIYSLPVMQHGAELELRYKLNMAPREDGVRLWVYTGDRAPDRKALFNDSLASALGSVCAWHQDVPNTAGVDVGRIVSDSPGGGPNTLLGGLNSPSSGTYEFTCTPQTTGGWPVEQERVGAVPGDQRTGYDETTAFGLAPQWQRSTWSNTYPWAFTGDIPSWITVRVNLTDWMERRVWILLEVATEDNDRGEDYFNDPSRFSRRTDYGFFLDRAYVEGSAYHRNFRMKDVAVSYPYQVVPNGFGDDNLTRTTNPPGNAPVVAWVHNAGDFVENGTVTLSARATRNGTASVSETLGTTRVNVTLRPDEVETIAIPWSRLLTNQHPTLREDHLYEVTATLAEMPWNETSVPELVNNAGNGTPEILDPNVTRIQPANAAGVAALNAGDLAVTRLVRATTDRDVTLVRVDGRVGNPLQLCRVSGEDECDEHYAGPKGEPRRVLVGVRNDGNAPQNITLDLTATLDGIGKPDIITDGARKIAREVLPGEVRAVTWAVVATQPGSYDLTISPMPELPVGVASPAIENAERKLFVQRATGLICLDSLQEHECGSKFTGDLVSKLRGEDVTASAVSGDGTIYVATAIREAQDGVHSGQLAARDAAGTWRVLANLSASLLNDTLESPPRAGYAYGSIRSIVPTPEGQLYLVGLNDTILRFTPTTGAIERVPTNAPLPTDLRAAIWYKGTLVVAGANGYIARYANATMEPFNVANTSYEPNAQNQTVATSRRYEGNFTSLLVAPNGNAMAAGQGIVLRHDRSDVATGWTEARTNASLGSRLVSDAIANATVLTLGVHGTRVVLGTSEAYWPAGRAIEPLWISAGGSTTGFDPIAAPPPVPEHARRTIWSVASQDGQLLVLYGHPGGSTEVAVCSERCLPGQGVPRWDVVVPQRPTVVSKTAAPHPAKAAAFLDTGDATLLLGEAGMVLDLLDVGVYANALDWTVEPSLAARNGGVIQTTRGDGTNSRIKGGLTDAHQSIYLVPDDANLSAAQSADAFRVFLNHSLNWSNAGKGVSVRLVYRNYPNLVIPTQTTNVHTCNSQVLTGSQQATAGDTAAVCEQSIFRANVSTFREPTSALDGWTFVAKELDAASIRSPLGPSDPVGLGFWALEVSVTDGVRWAMDDIRLEARVGGKWREIVAWLGPQTANGEWFVQDIYNHAFQRIGEPPNVPLRYVVDLPDIDVPPNACVNLVTNESRKLPREVDEATDPVCYPIDESHRNTIANALKPTPVPPNEGPAGGTINSLNAGSTQEIIGHDQIPVTTSPGNYEFEIFPGAPFEHATTAPWHISNDWADRPVFAANNEQYKENWSDPRGPRLMSNWDARLVSPVIDLTHAYDPVIAWRQAYSFRTFLQRLDDAQATVKLQVADGGFVEVQYTLKGSECGPDVKDPDFVCWSRFYPVEPEGGYPTREQIFPDVKATNYFEGDTGEPLSTTTYLPMKKRIGSGLSYWGSTVTPDETGTISATRRTEEYEEARVRLSSALCTRDEIKDMDRNHERRYDCIRDNLTGRQVRVAFHLITSGNYEHVYPAESVYATGTYEEDKILNSSNSPPSKRSFPGEGWYITDFRVLGAAELGIDLAADDLRFAVGYDVERIGVGPGTRVPINVTIRNNGAFETLGYTGRLEVRRVDRTLEEGSQLVDVVTLPQQPVLDAKDYRNHTIFWNVPPTEGESYALTFTVEPIGIDRDEDHLDNVDRLGTLIDPVPAKTVRRFKVDMLVSPESATAEITRYVPIFINNTGNVPLSDIRVERRISASGVEVPNEAASCAQWRQFVAAGTQTAIVDCREWDTHRPAPPGKLTALTVISDDVNPATDLFWKAPEQTSYFVDLAGKTGSGSGLVQATTRRLISAFATYLFDDVEGGVRGDARTGDWTMGTAWNATQPGFRSTDAYAFGDTALDRFPSDTVGAITSPTVDLGSARTASVAFYTNFAFEPGFDGAIIEASDDGGASWKAIAPIEGNELLASYNRSYELQASSPLHPDGNPESKAYAFTSDSELLPSNTDGWVLTQADLTDWTDLTEKAVEYEAYHAGEMSRYTLTPLDEPRNGTNVFFATDWCVGTTDDRCWGLQDLAHNVESPAGAAGEQDKIWWSGSGSIYDDGVRPIMNHLLEIPVDLGSVTPDQRVVASWWEYGTRFAAGSVYLDTADRDTARTLKVPGIYTSYSINSTGLGDNYRFNLGEPKVVEKRGHWYRMESDMTGIVDRLGSTKTLNVGFAYSPVRNYATNFSCTSYTAACTVTASTPGAGGWDWIQNSSSTNPRATIYGAIAAEDSGFAIDEFKIETYSVVQGVPTARATLLDEAGAWSNKKIWECGAGYHHHNVLQAGWHNQSNFIGCAENNLYAIRRPVPTEIPNGLGVGRNWNEVSSIPGVNGSWRTVPVVDHDGRSAQNKLPTGETPYAWYTGDIACRDVAALPASTPVQVREEVSKHCPRPNANARLMTPTFDLARVASDNAKLSFWHRFAFHQRSVADTPLASGGVIEISALDPQTGEWSEWDQLFASDDFQLDLEDRERKARFAPGRLVDPDTGKLIRGGYTGFTANASQTTDGPIRYDPPFKNVIPDDKEPEDDDAYDRDTAVQFLFTGNSKDIENALVAAPGIDPDGAIDGWLYEEFDVSKYIGRKVRFAFHYQMNGAPTDSQDDTSIQVPDPTDPTQVALRSGWWISDVAIVGDVLVGKPIQVRVRAATDGNVHDGHLKIDDFGVFGARYRSNVGLFVDETEDRYGAYPLSVTNVPVTLRNLGDTVRRDLAIQVRVVGEGVKVSGMGPEGNVTLDDGAFVLKGFTLGPGQSTTVDVKVHTPKDLPGPEATLVFQLREANPNSQLVPFGAIIDNEVQGLLTRIVDFRLQEEGEFTRGDARILQIAPRVGQTVDYVLSGQNTGHGPITLRAGCTARTVLEYKDEDHGQAPLETPIVTATYPCSVAGDLTLGPKEWTNLTFSATPTDTGFLQFKVDLGLVDTRGNEDNVTIPDAGVPVGVPLVAYRETFDKVDSVRNNFTGSAFEDSRLWSHTRGRTSPGALLVGINETLALQGISYNGACGLSPCSAITPPIDLHNFSATTPAFLSFYHMDRLARHDGAQVRAQVLLNEKRPTSEDSWSRPCILEPVNGYEGSVREIPDLPADPNTAGSTQVSYDQNAAFRAAPYNNPPGTPGQQQVSPPHFFITPGGVWEESWSLALIELPERCVSVDDGTQSVPFLGRTVRFSFEVYAGSPFVGGPGQTLNRGAGHGMLIDEISVGPLALGVRPLAAQRASMLDNTTKGFNVLLENLGTMPDVVTIEYDAFNSSAPTGSVRVPSETFTIQPGETRTATVYVTLPRDPSLLPTEFTARILAHSILDPNAAGATRLDLTFGPRQWAELAVTVEAPKGIVQEATETFIPVTIENSGLVDSAASKLRIVDEWAGGRIEHELDLPSMPSYAQSADEALRVLEFRWRPERGSAGPHTLTFVADPNVLGEEYTRENNVVTLTVPVSDLLIPDLAIANFSALRIRNAQGGVVTPGFDADVARYEVTAGEVVSFDLKVANKGRAGATNVEVRSFIGALSLPPKTIPYIAPGTEAVVTFNWLAQKGEHEIEFIVRNEQVELTPSNNRYPGRGVTLLTVKGYEVVVEIPTIAGTLLPESEIRVNFSITNNGNGGEDLELRAKSPAGTRLMLPRAGFFLRAGETYSDTARLILDAEAVAGQQFISIDAIARENPMKVATGRSAIGVAASYGGSIAGGFAAGAPPELVIPVDLVNEGNSLEPWKVYLDLPAGWKTLEPQPASVIVPAHGRATFEFHATIPPGTAPGDRVIVAKAVMPNGEKREGVAHVGVHALRAASVVVEDEAPAPVKGELAVPIRVQNTGNVREPFQLLLVDPPAGLEMRVEPAEFLLPPGGEAVATLVVKPNASIVAGTYAIAGFTHFQGVVPQTREGMANVQTLRVPIVRQDLRVTALEFSPRSELDAGDRVTIRASVTNFGQFDVENVPIHLYVDDVFAGEVLVPRVAAGARADVTFNWTAIDGVHTLTAVADPYKDTVDAGREDNAVSALAAVGVDAASGGIAAGRADAPMGGVWIALLAVVIGMVMTRRSGSWRRERR